MNRKELLKIINGSDNMKLIEDDNRFQRRITGIITLAKKTGDDGYIRDYSIINSIGQEFSGICFRRFENSSGDELTIEIREGAIRRCKETDFTAIQFGSVINSCGVIEYFFMSEDGKFVKVKPKDHRNFRPNGLIAETPTEFIEYLLTKEYDYHIPVTEETYDKLREAGWYEGRRVDISEIVKAAEEHNVVLTKEQKSFLEEFAGLESPDPNCKHGFCIEAKYREHQYYYDNPRDWDDDYFDDIDKNSDEYKRVPVRIGSFSRNMEFLELSPEGLLMNLGNVIGRTVMEGWECILN